MISPNGDWNNSSMREHDEKLEQEWQRYLSSNDFDHKVPYNERTQLAVWGYTQSLKALGKDILAFNEFIRWRLNELINE